VIWAQTLSMSQRNSYKAAARCMRSESGERHGACVLSACVLSPGNASRKFKSCGLSWLCRPGDMDPNTSAGLTAGTLLHFLQIICRRATWIETVHSGSDISNCSDWADTAARSDTSPGQTSWVQCLGNVYIHFRFDPQFAGSRSGKAGLEEAALAAAWNQRSRVRCQERQGIETDRESEKR
jgi:hypothetical protein